MEAKEIILGMFLVMFFLLVYFVPTFIGRRKKDAFWIFVLNLTIGWSVFGWLACLIWATRKD